MYELFIVSTPIGNLEDITFRAVRILKEVSLIIAEDTRNSQKLLKHFEIPTPIKSYHDFNKEKITPLYIEHLKHQGDIALISDAGTPCVADPGFYIVREALKEEIKVTPIPGASAILSALAVSGMPSDKFFFDNFAAKKSARRKKRLEELKEFEHTVINYVSPYQVKKFLDEILEVLGNITVFLSREITKKFEEHKKEKVSELIKYYEERTPKGEFVILFHPLDKG